MKELIDDLKKQVEGCVQCDEDPDDKSWNYQVGVLITENQANQIIDVLREMEGVSSGANVGSPVVGLGESAGIQDGAVTIIKEIRDQYDFYKRSLDRGKGDWPGQNYVKDDTWNGWLNACSVLEGLLRRFDPEFGVES